MWNCSGKPEFSRRDCYQPRLERGQRIVKLMSYAPDEPIPPQFIREALERVLASRDFRNSERKSRFLKFVVQETLDGRADRIKAYTIAVDVFDRNSSFDPGSDPTVRIEAGRLRRCLERYYLAEGAADPIWLTIPKGGYVPQFIMAREAVPSVPEAPENGDQPNSEKLAEILAEPIPATPAGDPAVAVTVGTNPPWRPSRLHLRRPPHLWTIILSVSVILIIALWVGTLLRQPPISGDARITAAYGPSLMVLPFANGTGDPAQNIFAEGFTEQLIGTLIRFKNVLVFDADTSFRYRTEPALRDAVPDMRIDYVVRGKVSRVGAQIEISVALLRATDHQYLWSDSFRREFSPARMTELRRDIATQIARVLAQPHGVIHQEEFRNIAGRAPETLSSYECVLRALEYWRQPNAELHQRVRTCLERTTQSDPHYADAWAALSMIYVDEARVGFNPSPARPDPVDTALQLAQHAVELEPDNPLPLQALGIAHWLRREVPLSLAAYEHAFALNPHDSDILANLGRVYSLLGDWEKGVPLLREAFERNPGLPSWYRLFLTLFHYVHGRYDEALAEARRIGQPDLIYAHAVLAMIYGQTGRRNDAAHEVQEILRLDPNYSENAVSDLERRNVDTAIIAKMVDGLTKAGLAVSLKSESVDQGL